MSSQCIAGCGFFGNPNTMNMCSQCFRMFNGGTAKPAPPSGENKKSVLKNEMKVNGITIQVRHGDMTEEDVDAIVNAANSSLDHASGLAGAIIKKGGLVIQQESDMYVAKNGRIDDGMVVVTTAGKLPCKHVIHAVGPVWKTGQMGEDIILGMTVRNCLDKADEMKLTSISLPAISSGIFGFPKDLCAKIMFEITIAYIQENQGKTNLKEIRFTNFDDKTVDLFEKECAKLKPNYS
eukprot:TRINITY_DN6922_c0_g1_i1.p1 TRINITY_DN6922_c0_g1~~TRINITY_DN6922_c0_g1_i1.p1  ORF type:complete len:236 (-),score=91.00 TRINITY_DN6922_c0_g1_i1:6-713(-)